MGLVPTGQAVCVVFQSDPEAVEMMARLNGIDALRRDIVICVLFFNRPEQTLECIRSFLPSGVAIHLLNNGSADSAVREMADAIRPYPQVRMLDAGGNRGVSGGRNMQIADTVERWLFFVDNDITVSTSSWLERLAFQILECPQAEVHVPLLYNKHESGWGYLADFVVDEEGRCTFVRTDSMFSNSFPGGASVIDRRLFERLGRYDEDLFVGFEDFEFAIRASRGQLPVLVRRADDIVLIHDHRASAREVDKQAAQVRYDWGAGDVDTAGEYAAWFIRSSVAGAKEHFPHQDHADPEFMVVFHADT
jgi:GT2 family glycosyltransferase